VRFDVVQLLDCSLGKLCTCLDRVYAVKRAAGELNVAFIKLFLDLLKVVKAFVQHLDVQVACLLAALNKEGGHARN
jgi:hypothetical protein